MRVVHSVIAIVGSFAILAACASNSESVVSDRRSAALDTGFNAILAEHGMASAGAAIIAEGEVVWTGYYGEARDGRPVDRETMFNTGSIAKTVAAELIVRLADAGTLSLDESMATGWVDPDLAEDPRHLALTPRLALSHRTGLPNWRYTDPRFQLRFQDEPGARYTYSGEGIEYAVRFAQARTGEGYEALVETQIVAPLGLSGLAVTPSPDVRARIVHPVAEDGSWRTPFCTDAQAWRCAADGVWSGADDLAVTVEDYARFMIAVMKGEGVSAAMQADRFTVQTSTAEDAVLRCPFEEPAACPLAQGYGLGWEIFEFADQTLISHGGSDWSERAIVYFEPESRDGIVLFYNGPASRSVDALIAGIRLLDPQSPMPDLYRGWVDAYLEQAGSGG